MLCGITIPIVNINLWSDAELCSEFLALIKKTEEHLLSGILRWQELPPYFRKLEELASDWYFTDEFLYFLAVVAEVKQGFTGDGFSKVKVN